MITRHLTVRFDRAVRPGTSAPERVECVVTPLNAAHNPVDSSTYVIGSSKQTAVLDQPRELVFELVPTDADHLTEPITYRISWRVGITGTISTEFFAMPDRDVSFGSLHDLGAIMDNMPYLTEGDLGVPGRAARLSSSGEVLDGAGDPVSVDLSDVHAAISQESENRKNAISSLDSTTRNRISAAETRVSSQQDASRNQLRADLNDRIDGVAQRTTVAEGKIQAVEEALPTKADLDEYGRLPLSQAPKVSIGTPHAAPDREAMLALTDVEVGDICVRPDGTWMLTDQPPSNPLNWTQITSPSDLVTSVNSQVGAVTLEAADVGARPADSPIPQGDVSGLTASLSGISERLDGHDSDLDERAVLEDGLIREQDLPATIALVSGDTIVDKDGNPVIVTGNVSSVNGKSGEVVLTAADVGAIGTGSAIPINLVQGLQDELSGKAPVDAPTFTGLLTTTEIRIPASDANGYVLTSGTSGRGTWQPAPVRSVNGQTGVVNLTVTDIDDLQSALDGKASKTAHQQTANQVSANTQAIANLQSSGGTGTGGIPPTVPSWNALGGDLSAVEIFSPFGIDESDQPYFDGDGAEAAHAAWPYITPNGRLELRRIDTEAAPDSPPATQDDLQPLSQGLSDLVATVSGKASQADLSTLSSQVDILSGDVAGKAPVDGAELTGTTSVQSLRVGTSATDGNVLTTDQQGNATWQAPAVASVAGHTGNVTLVVPDITGLPGALSDKAPLVSPQFTGTVRVSDLRVAGGDPSPGKVLTAVDSNGLASWTTPISAPVTSVAGMTGDVSLSTSDVSGLSTALAAKADLVGGKLKASQVPAIALNDVAVVGSKSDMLALSPSQVQYGDIAIIIEGPDQGSYILTGDNASDEDDWTLLSSATGGVSSVNGMTGTVNLTASDVGARSTSSRVPLADVSGLTAVLADKADVSDLADYAKSSAVRTSTPVKATANRCSTVHVSNRSGTPVVDGSTVSVGDRVLLTAQSSSADNGLWQVNTGSWTRAGDMPAGSLLLPGTTVIVTGGATQANTVWQMSNTTPVESVGNTSQHWTRSLIAAPPTPYTGGQGISVSGTTISAAVGTGLALSGGQITIDTATVPRKRVVTVPSGSATASVSHNLGTTDVSVSVYESATGNLVLTGVRATGTNTVSLFFNSPPASGQYRAVCIG